MCFSAHASFIAAAGLSIIGLLSIYRTYGRPSIMPLATLPLLFGIQQAFEGIVWLGLEGKAFTHYVHFATTAFLFFALILWPLYIPYAIYSFEHHENKRKLLLIPLFCGVAVAFIHAYYLFTQPVEAAVSCNHISYHYPLSYPWLRMILYAVATILPFFLTHAFLLRIFGVLVLVSAVVAHVFYTYNFGSVWCFFAAILSAGILFIVGHPDLRKLDSTRPRV